MNSVFDTVKPYADVVGRVLIAALFLVANGAGRLSVDARLTSLCKNRSS